ncbi:MAG TPA: HNH endonuclease domain-containing protein [Bacteroidia bacterium]|nr:HNH endonuclease domain-containing protein [Bacteroidia bacterium]
MQLPESNNLSVEKLSGVFNDKATSYKFFWFLSLLESFKSNNSATFLIDDLTIEMICQVWYPINYFKLSFGKQDMFESSIDEVQNIFQIQKDISKKDLKQFLIKNKNQTAIKKLIRDLTRYVPFRFLSPWFANELQGQLDEKKNYLIESLSRKTDSASLYRFKNISELEINPSWRNYILKHISILQGFTFWHLVNYLQKNNPNVPNIPDKLFPPEVRILSKAKKIWEIYLSKKNQFKCIYSSELILTKNFSIDHFLPWSFVAHDQLWNLIPTPKTINSMKSDNLPALKYLDPFCELQYNAFHFVLENKLEKEKSFEDYSILFKDSLTNILSIDKNVFIKTLSDNIKPLMQIATNMGFPSNWIYKL